MKSGRQRVLETLLAQLARRVVRRYRPTVVGITGSVGKTSTRDAVAAALRQKFRVGPIFKNYNNELGVPLTVLGARSGNRSVFGWLAVLFRGVLLLLGRDPQYPGVLVLEMAADRPGDIAHLVSIAPCSIGVLTAISHAHTEFFGSLEGVQREKAHIVTHLPPDGAAILNADDDRVMGLQPSIRAQVLSFGFGPAATVRAHEPIFVHTGRESGLRVTVSHHGAEMPFFFPGLVGRHQLYGPLAAIAVALRLGMAMDDIAAALRRYEIPAGRLKLLAGIRHTTILDDSYNASPAAAIAALDTLKELPGFGRRIACLGDMAELGAYEHKGHQTVGKHVAVIGLDMLLTVGPLGRKIADAAVAKGMNPDHIFSFAFAPEAGRFLQNRMVEQDLILVKGSQRVRMEKLVKEVMAEPERARELLVRQDAIWLAA